MMTLEKNPVKMIEDLANKIHWDEVERRQVAIAWGDTPNENLMSYLRDIEETLHEIKELIDK